MKLKKNLSEIDWTQQLFDNFTPISSRQPQFPPITFLVEFKSELREDHGSFAILYEHRKWGNCLVILSFLRRLNILMKALHQEEYSSTDYYSNYLLSSILRSDQRKISFPRTFTFKRSIRYLETQFSYLCMIEMHIRM